MYVILDHMSLVHALINSHAFTGADTVQVWVEFFGNPANYLPHTPLGSPFDFLPILVTDQKTTEVKLGIGDKTTNRLYWRHKYHPTYKSGRKPSEPLLNNVRELSWKLWSDAGLTSYSQEGFEADDFAAYFCKHYPDEHKYLVTIDSDWAGLVDDKTYWVDTYCQNPNYRKPSKRRENILDPAKVLDRFNNHRDFTSFHLDKPSDIYRAKHLLGDKSDSILGGESVDIGIISLIDPLETVEPITLPDTIKTSRLIPGLRCDMFGLPLLEWS